MEGIFRRLSRWCRNPKTFSRNCRSKAKKNALETSSLETWRSASNLWQMISFSPSFELLLLRLLVPVKTWHALVFAAFCTPSKSGTSTRVWHNWKICPLYSVDPSCPKNGHAATDLIFSQIQYKKNREIEMVVCSTLIDEVLFLFVANIWGEILFRNVKQWL